MALIGVIAFHLAVLAFVPIPEANQTCNYRWITIMSILTLAAVYH